MAGTRTSRRRSGFTLIELAVGMAILVIGVLGFSQSLVSAQKLDVKNREMDRAAQAAREVMERMRAESFPDVFRRFNTVTADDPGGAGTAPGAGFSVAGLTARAGDADGLPGEIIFPTLSASPEAIHETVVNAQLGMPRDLNGDGVIDAADHSTDYRVLPVIVRVSWRGVGGDGYYELQTMLADY
ncbi:MAG: prepilin-type N-terminal cleavage/methylation domain-containing protein [Planctomycetes bacterium]|nr:prepilin-type N-terminal cleavage/methylation domain-containing protein [Planctomycetota bacterium]